MMPQTEAQPQELLQHNNIIDEEITQHAPTPKLIEKFIVQTTSRPKIQTPSLDDILECLSRNERGDAELFLMLYKEKYLFDSSEGRNGEFYYWTGINWKLDENKQRYRDMKNVAECYNEAADKILEQRGVDKETQAIKEQLSKRAFALHSAKRIKSALELVAPEISFNGEWDKCPGKLPCINGVIDLKTGELLKHRPEFYIRSICPTKYDEKASRPLFDQFLIDVTLEDKELKAFLGRVLGSALLGDSKEEKIFIFYGENGRNGKGTLMQTLERVLGNLAKTFPSEMLLMQRNPPSSSTPRPEKANLQGVRFAIFSEINKGRKIDASEVKNLSGRDTITCRRLFSNKDIQISPTHTMIIQTNYKPEAPSDDKALWKRNVLVPFKAEFVEDPKELHQRKLDDGFKEKLLSEREGILAWLVESCLEYQEKGLKIPESVRDETEAYRTENDGIAAFISECCVIDSIFTTASSEMQKAITDFCKEEGYNVPNRLEISKALESSFRKNRGKKGVVYEGVSINNHRKIENEEIEKV